VVSTALPEVKHYPRELCAVADSHEGFEQAVIETLRNDSDDLRRRRSDAMKSETWAGRVAAAGEIVMRVKHHKEAAKTAAPPAPEGRKNVAHGVSRGVPGTAQQPAP
jgi:hypothetical protein